MKKGNQMFHGSRHMGVLAVGVSLFGMLAGCQPAPTIAPETKPEPSAAVTPPAASPTSAGNALPTPSGEKPAKLDAATKPVFDKAVAESKQRQWDAAIVDYKNVLAKLPNHVDSLANIGWMYAEKKNWSAAKENLTKALTIDPNNANALANLGWVYAEEKAWDNAISVLNKALQSNTNHVGAYTNLGWAYAEKNQWPQSEAASRKAIQLDPKNAYAYANLGWALKSQKKANDALAAYQKSVGLNPNNTQAILAIGLTYCEQGKKPQALEQSKQLFQKDAAFGTQLNNRISKGCP